MKANKRNSRAKWIAFALAGLSLHLYAQQEVGSSLTRDPIEPGVAPQEPSATSDPRSSPDVAPTTEPFLVGPGNWVPVSGPHLDQGNYQVLRGMLIHPGAGLGVRALDSIEDSVRRGQTGPDDPNLLALIEWASLSALNTRGVSLPPSASRQTDVRIRSARLLGLIGGENSLDVLMQILRNEYETSVLAEAYASIRKVNPRPTGELAALIARHLRDGFPDAPHNAMIAEILQTIESLNKGYGALATRDVFDAIFAVQQDSRYLLAVRNKALNLLKLMIGLQ